MVENATLIKFGLIEHIEKLRNEGLLYMNNLPFFWKLEDQELRGDAFDSVDKIERGKNGIITEKDCNANSINVTNWTLGIHPSEPDKINIFCMYALRPEKGMYPINKKNYKFGNHALILTNPQEFINRISSHLNKHAIKAKANLVDYIDDNYIGEIGPFKKLRRFSYQSEWRLVCYDGPRIERKIYIGSIQDISIIHRSKEVNKKMTLDSCGVLHWS